MATSHRLEGELDNESGGPLRPFIETLNTHGRLLRGGETYDLHQVLGGDRPVLTMAAAYGDASVLVATESAVMLVDEWARVAASFRYIELSSYETRESIDEARLILLTDDGEVVVTALEP